MQKRKLIGLIKTVKKYLIAFIYRYRTGKFVSDMNELSKSIGLGNSIWENPTGCIVGGKQSLTTARDLSILLAHSMNYPFFCHCFRKANRSVTACNENKYKSTYCGDVENVIFAKTGTGWGHYSLAGIIEVKSECYSFAIIGGQNKNDRYDALEQIINYIIHGVDTENGRTEISSSLSICVCRVAKLEGKYCSTDTYFSQNLDFQSPPLSVTKVLTLMTAMEHGISLNRRVFVLPSDFIYSRYDSQLYFKLFQRVKVEDLFCAALVASSNQSANIIARVC